MTVEPAQQEIINQLKSIDFGSLERTEELGRDYSFKVAVDQMREINSDILNIVENAGAIRIPNDVQQQVFSIAQRLVNISNNIRNFILKGNEGNASSQYQSIFNEVTGLVQEDLRVIVPLIERINILKLNTKDVENNIAKALNSIKEIEGIKTQAEHSKDNIDLAIKEVRDALGKEGALISANEFHKQAVEHEELAKIWFKALIGSVVITIILVLVVFGGHITSLNLETAVGNYLEMARIVVFKLVLLSISYFLIQQCLQNYKINRHLYVLNKHRQLVLSVYPLMAKATNDQEQSNTIVAQASKAIFEQNTTGYLSNEDNPNPINLTEVVTKIIDKKAS